LATLSHLHWDSSIFGLPMAKIGHLIAASAQGSRAQILDRLLEELIELARTQGIRHLSTRMDCADIEAIQCLEHRGFRLMECLITYIFRPKQDILPRHQNLATSWLSAGPWEVRFSSRTRVRREVTSLQ
jgi:hypothetical protein